ncbi:MAG: sigma factor-like helix-turn-helix DNA-binding protein, partial [Brevibacillus sp.]
EVLGVTEGTVRTRLHRARQQLRQRMESREEWEWNGTNGCES